MAFDTDFLLLENILPSQFLHTQIPFLAQSKTKHINPPLVNRHRPRLSHIIRMQISSGRDFLNRIQCVCWPQTRAALLVALNYRKNIGIDVMRDSLLGCESTNQFRQAPFKCLSRPFVFILRYY